MKIFQKLFSFLLAGLMLFAVACGGDEPQSTGGGSSESGSGGETHQHVFEDYQCSCGEWQYDFITIEEALVLCGEEGNITKDRYYIKATIKTVTNPQFGAMVITDETGEIAVYGTYSADGKIGYSQFAEKPYKGDEVVLYCILQNYNGTKEVKNARLIDFTRAVIDEDETAYTEMTIAQAREAEVDTKVKVDGVIAAITYANGMKPNGVYLVDETQSIYVFDGDLAGRVSVGNKVTILASKTYWILDKEQENAAKFGYKGCNQLENATLVNSDNGNNAYDKSWMEETTVKAMLETPVTEDVTTTVYKVNALVKKVPGNGFVNYYFFDIDGETGSYTYTQCNGGDFAWIDKYDNKICTVYLAAHNAKSTATACGFRFMPIEIVDENYSFDLANAAKFAVDYYALDQFESVYYADPNKEMVTSVSSELLGFTGATISYSSSNTQAVYFEEVEGKTMMRCATNGTATVTITASYGSYDVYETTVSVQVLNPDQIATVTVADAIVADVDETVLVRGFVGPSIVNKNGFYLFGADGSMIAVLVKDVAEFKGLQIGHEVILEGRRERHVKDKTQQTYAGQACLMEGDVIINLYGETEYSTAKFVEKTVAEFYALDKAVDYSTSVFVVEAEIVVKETPFYTQLLVQDGSQTITLYCSGAGQYKFLQKYAGQKVTIEIAACNWNDKGYWAGCVLAVRLEDGTKEYNTLNFDSYA